MPDELNLRKKLINEFWSRKLKNKKAVEVSLGEFVCSESVFVGNEELRFFYGLGSGHYLAEYSVLLCVYSALLGRFYTGNRECIYSQGVGLRGASAQAPDLLFSFPDDGEATLRERLEYAVMEVRQVTGHADYDQAVISRLSGGAGLCRLSFFGFSYFAKDAGFAPLHQTGFHLHIEKGIGGLRIWAVYPVQWEAGFPVQEFLRCYLDWLRGLEGNLAVPLSSIPVVSEAARRFLIHELGGGGAAEVFRGSIADRFESQVRSTPEAQALVYGDLAFSYDQLNAEANCLAGYLRNEEGIGPSDIVAVGLSKSPKAIIALLAIMKAGAVYLPVDPGGPGNRLRMMLGDAGAKCVITESGEAMDTGSCRPVFLDRLDLAGRAAENCGAGVSAEEPAYVIYTSGSTGVPKGVLVGHRGVMNMISCQISIFGITGRDNVVWFAAMTFDASISEILMALLSGATLLIPEKEVSRTKDTFVSFLREKKATVMTFLPDYLDLFQEEDLSGLRCIISAGAPARLQRAVALAGSRDYFNAYGPTECSVCVSIFKVSQRDRGRRSVPIGRPIGNISIYVLDRNLQVLPVGVEGGIYVSGQGVAKGYLNKPVLTDEKFIRDPFVEGQIMYDTGDLGRWLGDGNLEYLGRGDEQVKIRGMRIEPGEVEHALLSVDRAIRRAVVVCLEVNGDSALAAYLVCEELDEQALRRKLADLLPAYMIPSYFVRMDGLPLSASGKVDKKGLPPVGGGRDGRMFCAPGNPTEEKLLRIWVEILGHDAISVTDNFFESGGHSIKATILSNKIYKTFAIEIDLPTIFSLPTIRQQGAIISELSESRYEILDLC